jgi:predicted ATPase/DNA-binding SARP family transcriptional activator
VVVAQFTVVPKWCPVRSPPVEVRVLGPVELFDGNSVVQLPRSERTLLAALAARVGERVPVAVLEEALWPAERPPSARKTLQGNILRLRRAMGSSAIVELDGGYRLDPELVEVDARRVATLVAGARDAMRRQELDVALELLAAAREAFRGQPYEGVPDTALPAGEVHRLADLRETIFEDSVDAELGGGGGERWIGELEAFVQVNPYRERAWGLLMRALYQAGRPADALAAYGRARVLLAAELGIEPGPALREIERAILAHDARLLPARAASRRLGPANLPAAVSPLVGRQLELAVLDPLLSSERLITLTGVGGIGKTRLAVELAAQPVGRHRFGPYFVDLAAVGDVELVPAAVVVALGIAVEPTDDVMTVVRDALVDHEVLVVVDNCEHLLPGVAELVGGLLMSCSGLRVLATSREALGVAGERVCPVDPLGIPPAEAAVDQIEESDAGALFLARLPMNMTTGPLGPEEFAAVAGICRRLDGIPLGLELAAARCRTMSLSQLADRLDRSIGELAPARHGVPPRHRTMRAALDWGFALLSPAAQAALRAMSVFSGGCDLVSFAAVCVDDDGPADDVLDELVRTSFATALFATERTRYRLLEPVRQYARELLEASGDAAGRHRRHLAYHLELAGTLTEDIDQIGFDTQWDELRPELGNLRAALDWAAGDRESCEAGLILAARLWDVWASDGHHHEGLSRIVELLASGAGSPEVRSRAAYAAGFIAANVMGDDARGVSLWEHALTEAQAGDDRLGEVRVRRVLATCAFARGDVATARRHLETAIPIATDDGNEVLHAHCEIALSEILHWTGDLDGASERIGAVLDGPVASVGPVATFAHLTRVPILVDRGDYAAARASAQRAAELAESHSMLHCRIEAHLALAEIEIADGNVEQTATHLAAAENLSPDSAAGWDPWFVQVRAEIALLEGRSANARGIAEQAVALIDGAVTVANQCSPLGVLGRAQLASGEPEVALRTFEQLIAVAGIAPYPLRLADGYEGAAAAAVALARPEMATRYLAAADEIRQRTGARPVPRPVIDEYLTRLASEPPVAEAAVE